MPLPIVLQLQEIASGSDHGVADLLRKALVVASKLQLPEFKDWILNELNGYTEPSALPDYRSIRGDLRAQNPYQGLIPFIINNLEIRKTVNLIRIRESITSIEQLVTTQPGGEICYYFAPEQEAALMKMQGAYPLRPLRVVGPNQLLAIIQAVRTRILEWALSLEAEGILGDGLSFSETERKIAMASNTIKIENFQGVLGDVHGGAVTQNNSMTVNSGSFASLAAYLRQQGIDAALVKELEVAIAEDPEPALSNGFGPRVSQWIGKMMTLAASGGWEVSIATAGTLLAASISKFYGL
jgi:AbiTii